MHRARASEFPNDNPLLHEGAIWTCLLPCGPLETIVESAPALEVVEDVAEAAVAISRDSDAEPAAERIDEIHTEPLEDLHVDTVDETEVQPVEDARVEPLTSAILPIAPEGFGALIHALVSISLAAGNMRAAAALPDLLEHGRLEAGALEEATEASLAAAGLVERGDTGLCASERLASLVHAWRGVLDRHDFSECGDVTLNEWAAELLGAILGPAQGTQALQYQLRRHGVAAFGLVKLAA